MKVFLVLLMLAASASAQPARRALLIGIDDYSASTLLRPPRWHPEMDRGWPDLKGAANDVEILYEMLICVHGFAPSDIVTLKNQQATRAAILQKIELHLVQPSRKGDVVFYYFAGHGSQVPNDRSDEPDRHDESIVPADSRLGAPDIRDKELRPLFNRILDRGAHLTLLLDHCHSGSSFRGLPGGARPRGILPAPRIADATRYGPRPEERGALVLASTQDLDEAWETRGDDGKMHGSFTWAWIRAMRDAAAGEPAQETFLRAQARMRAETPDQAPAMLGSVETRRRPFLGIRVDRRGDRAIVAVERAAPDGTIVLQGGWANGLAVGTTLRGEGVRLRVTAMLGLSRSIARVEEGVAENLGSGGLVEVVDWAAPPARPLRVWMPRSAGDVQTIARRLAAANKARWSADPLEASHVLRPRRGGWELFRDGTATPLTDRSAIDAIARLGSTSTLFVQFAAPQALIDAIGAPDGIVVVDDPPSADYILVGRYQKRRMDYAWMRPLSELEGALPPRSAWTTDPARLRESLLKLRRIHAWHVLEPPPNVRTGYRLALRHEETQTIIDNDEVIGGETYTVVLRLAAPTAPRYYYAFAIDSFGKSYLIFPRPGSVENRFPIRAPPPAEIALGQASAFGVMPPFGNDTFILLSSEEPLPNEAVLEWDGVRAPAWTQRTTRWSIERVVIKSVPGGSRHRRR